MNGVVQQSDSTCDVSLEKGNNCTKEIFILYSIRYLYRIWTLYAARFVHVHACDTLALCTIQFNDVIHYIYKEKAQIFVTVIIEVSLCVPAINANNKFIHLVVITYLYNYEKCMYNVYNCTGQIHVYKISLTVRLRSDYEMFRCFHNMKLCTNKNDCPYIYFPNIEALEGFSSNFVFV